LSGNLDILKEPAFLVDFLARISLLFSALVEAECCLSHWFRFRMQLSLAQGLREIILSVLEDSPSEEQVTRLVRSCHALAQPFVASKWSGGYHAHLVVGLSASDLAYDCMGDLFRRDDRGSLVQIRAYFASLEISNTTETEMLMHLRRLVFSAVNQGIYRLYRQADPAFGKILRNIKLAIATLQNFTEIERFGEPHLVPAMVDPLMQCPPFETGCLERALAPLVNNSQSIPALLGALSLVLREQEECSRAVALTTVAALFRSIYARGQIEEGSDRDPHDTLMQEQMRAAIRQAVCEAVTRTFPGYCREYGWVETYADAYQSIVERNLALRLLENDGAAFSYFTGLQAFLPDLTRDEYQALHKNKVEYVGRLAYEILIAELKKELKR